MPIHKRKHAHHHAGHGGAPKHPGAKPPNKTAGYGITPAKSQSTKEFNRDLLYVQGFRQAIGAGATVLMTISLTAPGKWLHGFAFIPTAASDITDVQLTLLVNNNNVTNKIAGENCNPGFTQGQIFFPTPQPLSGNDTITLSVTNNGAASVQITANFFYVPQGQ
jgi:hypothetical protein